MKRYISVSVNIGVLFWVYCYYIYIYILINIKVYCKTLPQFRILFMVLTLALTKEEKEHNIKNRKLNCSLHTKKTNNINKLIQINYYYALIKIQKLQN